MIRPACLRSGDKVAIVAPARSVTFAEIHPAIRFFTRHEMEVVLGSYIFNSHHQFGGTDDQRRRDLQKMLDDDNIRAIFCARGGYGILRIIDQLDFTRFCMNPKWIVGYSDVTVLHAHIHQCFGVETLHAVMPYNIGHNPSEDALGTLIDALKGEPFTYEWKSSSFNRPGEAEGVLVGGNLSILYALSGSASSPETSGKILFIEDLDEYLYHLDRMILNLKRSGKLERLAGLLVGGLTDMHDNPVPFGKTACEIIADAVQDYTFPVCFDFPAGHIDNNLALILGRRVRLTVDKTSALSFY